MPNDKDSKDNFCGRLTNGSVVAEALSWFWLTVTSAVRNAETKNVN